MSLGLGEVVMILVIAFVVVGPQDLPKIARAIAKAIRQLKGLYATVKDELSLETELSQVKEQVHSRAPSDLEDIYREIKNIK